MDRMLNVTQCCAMLGCSRSYVYQLVGSGRISAVRLGARRGIRVRASALRAFIATRTVEEEKNHDDANLHPGPQAAGAF